MVEAIQALTAGMLLAKDDADGDDFVCESAKKVDLNYDLTDAGKDFRHLGDPNRLSVAELYDEILLPALRNGDLPPVESEADFRDEVFSLPVDVVRDWASVVLKENPWPPGFYVPSFVEFVTSPFYLGSSVYPSERQINAIHDSIGPDAHAWFVDVRRLSCVVLCWGKGSGKDLLSSWVCAYVAWTVMHMRNPWFHFDMPLGEPLDIVNVAQDQDSAREVFFTKLKNAALRDCFASILEDQRKDIQADIIVFKKPIPGERFPRVCVRINSLHSKNEKAEGRNTFLYIMDEADAMRDAKGHGNARRMHHTLTTSNRFGARQLGFVISYPRAANGFMFELLQKCGNRGGATVEWWGDLAATYRVLPFKTYRPIKVNGQERWTNDAGVVTAGPDLEMSRLYRDDPETFRAMYECNPPAAEDAYFSIPKKIDECIISYLEPAAGTESTIREDRDPTTRTIYRYVGNVLRNLRLRKGVVYYIGADAGEVEDSFALCLSHMVPPAEQGFCSAESWADPNRRYVKHYRPEALPVNDPNWHPSLWKCDFTGEIPVPGKHEYWGVCRPSGRKVIRPVTIGLTEEGEPQYKYDQDGAAVVEEVHLPHVVEDLLIEWVPNRARGMTVDYRNVRDIIIQIGAAGQIGMCFFDRWNATSLIQDIRAAGIPAESKTFGAAAQLEWYRHFKMLVYNNGVDLLPGQEKARHQLRELQLVNGNKIDHPQYSAVGGIGGKDLTDAEALAFWLACDAKYAPARIDFGGGAAGVGMEIQSRRAKKKADQGRSIVNDALIGTGVRL